MVANPKWGEMPPALAPAVYDIEAEQGTLASLQLRNTWTKQ